MGARVHSNIETTPMLGQRDHEAQVSQHQCNKFTELYNS